MDKMPEQVPQPQQENEKKEPSVLTKEELSVVDLNIKKYEGREHPTTLGRMRNLLTKGTTDPDREGDPTDY